MIITKYFWDLNEKALKDTERILRNTSHPKFILRMVTFLSRCDQPKELFSIISKKEFIEVWPKIRNYWIRLARESDFRDWWETIYEQLLQKYKLKQRRPKGRSSALFLNIGRMIREARIRKNFSQRELALTIGMRQPDISTIEEGKKNITLETLLRLCKALEIKSVDI